MYFSNPQSVDPNPSPTSPTPPPGTPPPSTLDPKNLIGKTSREIVQTCTTDMATQFHIHQHLAILIEGQPVEIPSGIGIDSNKNCMSPLHTHEPGGILHVESPVQVDFHLSDFFFNWDLTFNKNEIQEYKVDKDHGLKFYVDGVESDDYENLVLKDHQEITIVYYKLIDGPGKLPPPYDWKNLR